MKVLSLFDGISCLRVALGDRVTSYHASEIDKHAIKIANKNYPDTKHIGDVKSIKPEDYKDIDLLCGGSPCQDLSISKQGRKGLEGERSGLFWTYLKIKNAIKPKWFILENVASMPKKDRDIITKEMGVEPIMINASLVSAQCRKRLFWTNIPVVGLPEDRKILLKDILQADGEVDERMVSKGKAHTLTASYNGAVVDNSVKKKQRTMVKLKQVGYVGNTNSQGNRVYDPDGKSVCLSANGGGRGAKTGLYKISPYPIHTPTNGTSTENVRVGHEQVRKLNADGTRAEEEENIERTRRIEARGDDKCGTLTSVQKDNYLVNIKESKIRKLTPVECERLQCLPDNYTAGISNTQRYRSLGNGFNVEVIKFILSFIPKTDSG